MNREILFRGKSVDAGEWVYGYYVSQYGAHEIVFPDGQDCDGFESRHILPETLCQYTGSPDKKGNKIFDGDILRVQYHPVDDCIVEWSDGSFRLRWVNRSKREEYGRDYNAVCCVQKVTERRSVVGNVYDNQELVKN